MNDAMRDELEVLRCPGRDWVAPAIPLHLEDLGWDGFEKLCLQLALLEGYKHAHRFGSGYQGGLDLEALSGDQRIGFQCKISRTFGPVDVRRVFGKVLSAPKGWRPARLILIVTGNLTAGALAAVREQARKLPCVVWAGDDLEAQIKRHPLLLRQYFPHIQAPRPWLGDSAAARRQQQSQAAGLGLAVEWETLGIPFLLVPEGCLEAPTLGRALQVHRPVYLAKRPLHAEEVRDVLIPDLNGRKGDRSPRSGLSVDLIHRFIASANQQLSAKSLGWRLDFPTRTEILLAIAAGGELSGAESALGFEGFYERLYQCCRGEPSDTCGWLQVGGPLEPGALRPPFERAIPIRGTSGVEPFMGFRPALRTTTPPV